VVDFCGGLLWWTSVVDICGGLLCVWWTSLCVVDCSVADFCCGLRTSVAMNFCVSVVVDFCGGQSTALYYVCGGLCDEKCFQSGSKRSFPKLLIKYIGLSGANGFVSFRRCYCLYLFRAAKNSFGLDDPLQFVPTTQQRKVTSLLPVTVNCTNSWQNLLRASIYYYIGIIIILRFDLVIGNAVGCIKT
jgi:hypothetical protein